MSRYFITGLPRSRTCWLSNLLTNGDSFCFHAGLLQCGGDVEKLPKLLDSRSETHVGDSDPPILCSPFFERIVQLFPQAKWVFVSRRKAESFEAYHKAFPEIPVAMDMLDAMSERIRDRAMGGYGLTVRFEDLDDFEVCDEIHQYLLGRPLDFQRWQLLARMNIQADKKAWLRSMDPETRAKIEAVARK